MPLAQSLGGLGLTPRPCCPPTHPADPLNHNPAAPRMQQLRLVLGLHVLGEPSPTYRIKKVVLHPKHKPPPHLENDLVLLKVLPVGGW